ncbi:MAG TPA: hypothetical protein VGP07_16190 [Polyangia bacterium]
MFRHLMASALVIALASRSALASAPPRTARLSYTRAVGADECPEEDSVRAGIAARLGYEPFDEAAAALAAGQRRSGMDQPVPVGGARIGRRRARFL